MTSVQVGVRCSDCGQFFRNGERTRPVRTPEGVFHHHPSCVSKRIPIQSLQDISTIKEAS